MVDSHYISETANIMTHDLLESGVVKIKEGREHSLSRREKRASSSLLKETPNENVTISSNHVDSRMLMAQQLAKCRKKNETNSKYIDCSFIVGSVTEV